jgi:hypothetical protein
LDDTAGLFNRPSPCAVQGGPRSRPVSATLSGKPAPLRTLSPVSAWALPRTVFTRTRLGYSLAQERQEVL